MSTRHVLLSLLEIEPSSGYDLAFRSVLSLGPLWSATHSQVYTALHKLLDDGLIYVDGEHPTGQRRRTVYALTDSGREELATWRHRPVQYLPNRDPFRLWMQYMDVADPSIALKNVNEHIRRHEAEATELEAHAALIRSGRGPILERRKNWMKPEEVDRARIARSAVYCELAERARFEAESARRLRETLFALHPELRNDASS